jgi:hypothetical protein
MPKELAVKGTKQEIETFTEVYDHYVTAKEDLEQRIPDWDTKDELFRSYINESDWPYNSVVFDPRVFTAIFEKTARLFANKPRGRMVPREGGDALGARINNELLRFQWDDVERVDSMPMLAKWSMMDMNARKYGASFGLVKWHYERIPKKDGKVGKGKSKFKSVPFFDGPSFKPLINRDCLPNPAYSMVKNWFQVRDYPTLQELERVNDVARTKPSYKNLDILRQQLHEESTKSGDRRDINWTSRNKTIKGLIDYLGTDEMYRTVEVVTEYRNNRWVTIAPKYGVVLRDIENPYEHQQIPVVMMKYYPIDDDLYGLSEIEPVERLQKATNALINQYLDAVNMSLYTPLKVRAHGVQMHTLEFGPGKKWIMNEPSADVLPHDSPASGVQEFVNTYSFMVSAMQSALGETSQGISNLSHFESEKTATEVRDTAMQRNARDNFNQIFMSEAIKKQMMFWHTMNRQFLFSDPREQQRVIRITGKEAIRYFQQRGLDGTELMEGAEEQIAQLAEEGVMVPPQELVEPMFPVQLGDMTVPKFNVEDGGESATMIVEPEDLAGTYDYIPDIESMRLPDNEQMIVAKREALKIALDPVTNQLLATQGHALKVKELFEDYLEQLGLKDADKYFERMPDGAQQAGAGVPQAIPMGGGNGLNPGMGGGSSPLAGGEAGPVVPGPGAV